MSEFTKKCLECRYIYCCYGKKGFKCGQQSMFKGQHILFSRKSGKHQYKGSLFRHLTVERAIIKVSVPTSWMGRFLNTPNLYKLVRLFVEIAFGLNCNLPIKDVLTYCCSWLLWGKFDKPFVPIHGIQRKNQ